MSNLVRDFERSTGIVMTEYTAVRLVDGQLLHPPRPVRAWSREEPCGEVVELVCCEVPVERGTTYFVPASSVLYLIDQEEVPS